MNINREDVVQSALNVQRWCKEHCSDLPFTNCNCPFDNNVKCILQTDSIPASWNLEEFLRTRGVKDGK